jgi:hypothetical protein
MSGLRQLDNYVCASFQEPVRCMALEMMPFSLGHLFWLQRWNNPYASDDPDTKANGSDLMLATLICSRTFEGVTEFLEARELKHWNTAFSFLYNRLLDILYKVFRLGSPNASVRWLRKWDKQLGKAFHKNKLDALEEFGKFNQYRKTDLYVPYFTVEVQGDRPSGAHWSMNVYQFLKKELGYSQTEVLNMPLARALVENYKGLESCGVITLHDDSQCAIEEGTIKQ